MLGREIKNPRLLALVILGFSSGLPLALTSSTLQAWFTQSGISILAIGSLSLVGMPYIWKFLWAPLMDRFIPPILGRRRGWIVVTQLGLVILLALIANMDPKAHAVNIGVVALVIAFMGATQDVAIDAYRTDIMLPGERGLGIAYFIFAFRIAMLVSGGLALVLADHIGWHLTYDVMAVLILLSLVTTFFVPESPQPRQVETNLYSTMMDAFKNLLQRDSIFLILAFIVLYKLGDALVVALTSNFLLRDLGFSLTDVGLAYKTVGLIASLMGAFVGGILLMRIGLYRGLWIFGFAQACSNFMFMLLAWAGKNYALMVGTIFAENFCGGMSSVALLAFLTSLCNLQYSATHYAYLSAVASLGRVIVGPFAAIFVERMGWISFYGWATLACFPALIVLSMLRTKVSFNVETVPG